MCKEFWNEYNEFIEWLNETEDSTRKSEDAAKLGLETSKSRLKRFEVIILQSHCMMGRVTLSHWFIMSRTG